MALAQGKAQVLDTYSASPSLANLFRGCPDRRRVGQPGGRHHHLDGDVARPLASRMPVLFCRALLLSLVVYPLLRRAVLRPGQS
jgi:hypothetical protein